MMPQSCVVAGVQPTGKQPESSISHLDNSEQKKSPACCLHPSLPYPQTPKCQPRVDSKQESVCCQLFSAELPGLWCSKERNCVALGALSFLVSGFLTFKSHLSQLKTFICRIWLEFSKTLQIPAGQREKTLSQTAEELCAVRQRNEDAPWREGRSGVWTHSTAHAQDSQHLWNGSTSPQRQSRSLLLSVKRKRAEIIFQKVLCLSTSDQVTDVSSCFQGEYSCIMIFFNLLVFTCWAYKLIVQATKLKIHNSYSSYTGLKHPVYQSSISAHWRHNCLKLWTRRCRGQQGADKEQYIPLLALHPFERSPVLGWQTLSNSPH